MSEPYNPNNIEQYIHSIREALELLYDLASSHTKAILVQQQELEQLTDEHVRLRQRVSNLEERITAVASAAAKGESAWAMQQPLGGTGV
jgi:hypothetical protein